MRLKEFKNEKGVAGLTIFMSLIIILFVIGLLVMVFSLMGGELQDATWDITTVSVTNETGFVVNTTSNDTVATAGLNEFQLVSLNAIFNTTGTSVPTANFSFNKDTGLIYLKSTTANNNDFLQGINVSYTYTYGASNTETEVIGNTTDAIGGSIDWFDIFIVIGAMVVLILLTVIIISAIRGSGLMGDGGMQGNNRNIGSA
jgi:hypothetical protein